MISISRDISDYFSSGIVRSINDKGQISRPGLEIADGVIASNGVLTTDIVENMLVLNDLMLDKLDTFVFNTSIGTIICSESTISVYNPATGDLKTVEVIDNQGNQVLVVSSPIWKVIDCFGYVILSSELEHFRLEKDVAVRYKLTDALISLVGERLFVNVKSQTIIDNLKDIYKFDIETNDDNVVWIGEPAYSDSILKIFENISNAISQNEVYDTKAFKEYNHFLTNRMRDGLILNFVVPTNELLTSITGNEQSIFVSTFSSTYQFTFDSVNNNLVVSYVGELFFGVVNNHVSFVRGDSVTIVDVKSNLYQFSSEGLRISNLSLPAIYSLNSHFNSKHGNLFLAYESGTICVEVSTGIVTTLPYRYLGYDSKHDIDYVTSYKKKFKIKSNWIFPMGVSNPLTIKSAMLTLDLNEKVRLKFHANNRKRTYAGSSVIVNQDGAVHSAIYGVSFSVELTGEQIKLVSMSIEYQIDNRHYRRSQSAG